MNKFEKEMKENEKLENETNKKKLIYSLKI
jgi:hypothetical protein